MRPSPSPAPPVTSGESPDMSSTSNSTCSPHICRRRRTPLAAFRPSPNPARPRGEKACPGGGYSKHGGDSNGGLTAGMKLAGAEGEPECAICLSEFVEGDGIQVLAKCKHGFHVQCIQQWLASNSSCPTCRCSCLPPSPAETTRQCVNDDGSRPVIP
ncbi:RING-H2 finger protein ATL79 [Hibiscus syriacus]|uniref:RING-type E3 ubiquitin transferase n=1 Tax=Hibiscus syriacus TaxID=106335 RepID=A0A6A3BZF2_HIBSY|nr:RING-H2 finger protein ATL79 [Hibiscus syriacus]